MSEYVNESLAGGDYEWRYEYYDDEDPVSYEGLKANRYSIVIGFWVGLAVFVIFMFFVLILLTKTGAAHPEVPEAGEKHHGQGDGEVGGSQVFSLPPLLDESRSLFHFYIHEEEQLRSERDAVIGRGRNSGRGPADGNGLSHQGSVEEERGSDEEHFLSSFNIPNFVNSECGSSVATDDLLLCGAPIIVDSQSPALNIISLEPAHISYDVSKC